MKVNPVKTVLVVAFLLGCLTLTGCVAILAHAITDRSFSRNDSPPYRERPYRLYAGADRATNDIAVLHASHPAVISKVDETVGPARYGKFSVFLSNRTIELLPGPHTLVLNYYDSWGITSTRGAFLRVALEAGRTYELTATVAGAPTGWRRNVLTPAAYSEITYTLRDAVSGAVIPLERLSNTGEELK